MLLGASFSVATEITLTPEVGLSTLRFNYVEYADTGRVLDTEQGGMPGLTLKLEVKQLGWVLEGVGSYHQAQVSYTGETNFGVPYNTHTDEKIGDVAVRVGRWFDTQYPVMPFAGIGYRRWDRDILPATLGGLFESYHWKYAWIGAKVLLSKEATAMHVLDIGLLKPIHPKMAIDFKGAFNASPQVFPEARLGLRLLLSSKIPITQEINLVIEPYGEYWELGRSPLVTQNAVSVYEPQSKTRNIGLNVRIGKNF